MSQTYGELNVCELELLVGKGNIIRPLAIYLDTLGNVITQLNSCSKIDEKWLKSTVHQIKSSAQQLNLITLRESAERLENALVCEQVKQQDLDDFRAELIQARDAVAVFLVANKLDK
jgi:HPt (histidine-containing phosphotransfer) domain-containing protein